MVETQVAEETNDILLGETTTQKDKAMITFYQFKRIRELKAEGKSGRKIAKSLNISRNTVRDYLNLNRPPKYKARVSKVPTIVESIQDVVNALLTKNNNNSRREVHSHVLKKGFQASEGSVGRAMANYRATLPKERFFEQKYEPGEQQQVDFKEELSLPFVDGPRTVQLFVASLPYSGVTTGKAFPNKNYRKRWIQPCRVYFLAKVICRGEWKLSNRGGEHALVYSWYVVRW